MMSSTTRNSPAIAAPRWWRRRSRVIESERCKGLELSGSHPPFHILKADDSTLEMLEDRAHTWRSGISRRDREWPRTTKLVSPSDLWSGPLKGLIDPMSAPAESEHVGRIHTFEISGQQIRSSTVRNGERTPATTPAVGDLLQTMADRLMARQRPPAEGRCFSTYIDASRLGRLRPCSCIDPRRRSSNH